MPMSPPPASAITSAVISAFNSLVSGTSFLIRGGASSHVIMPAALLSARMSANSASVTFLPSMARDAWSRKCTTRPLTVMVLFAISTAVSLPPNEFIVDPLTTKFSLNSDVLHPSSRRSTLVVTSLGFIVPLAASIPASSSRLTSTPSTVIWLFPPMCSMIPLTVKVFPAVSTLVRYPAKLVTVLVINPISLSINDHLLESNCMASPCWSVTSVPAMAASSSDNVTRLPFNSNVKLSGNAIVTPLTVTLPVTLLILCSGAWPLRSILFFVHSVGAWSAK